MALTETAKSKILADVQSKLGRDFPTELLNIYVQAFIDNNQDADEAILVMRQSDQYKSYFPGNVNPDGVSVKYTAVSYTHLTLPTKRIV